MSKKRVFMSFDFDNDEDLHNLLAGQSKNPDSPFELSDWSVKEPFDANWKEKVREKIRRTDLVIVICGEMTAFATGVNVEVQIAKEENIPYFLIWGRSAKSCSKPPAAVNDKIYKWTWDNLKALVGGAR